MADVVIAEDTSLQMNLLECFLRSAHEIVGKARDGDDAVWLASVTKPDVVVMDVNMPRKDGIRATADIKSIEPDVRIIVSTFFLDQETRDRIVEAGADAILVKPYGRADLLEEIDSCVAGA